jgi:succinyl-CoA synthetase beta subunit
MKIHEYQAKEVFRDHHIPVPEGYVATSPDEARAAAEKLGSFPVVIKAQIHAGGRGKGGGVKLAKNIDEARSAAEAILGRPLVTPQTGPEGKKVGKVLVEQGLDIAQELYFSILPDRSTAKIMIIASRAGGMNIEEVAAQHPEKIIRVLVNPLTGIEPGRSPRVSILPVRLPDRSPRWSRTCTDCSSRPTVPCSRSIRSSSPRGTRLSRSMRKWRSTTTPCSGRRTS